MTKSTRGLKSIFKDLSRERDRTFLTFSKFFDSFYYDYINSLIKPPHLIYYISEITKKLNLVLV